MNKITAIAAILLSVAALTGCRSSEQNYKNAYDTVRRHQEATGTDGIEGTVYNRFRERAHTSAIVTEQGDTIDIRIESIGFTADGGATRKDMLAYNVVVGGFKQVFNAKAMRDRLIGLGYKAFVVHTAEPVYYVVAATADTPEQIAADLHRVEADTRFTPSSGYPIILCPLHLRR